MLRKSLITAALLVGLVLAAGTFFVLTRCERTDTGYACSLNGGALRYGFIERNFEFALTQACYWQGGRYDCPGQCLPGNLRYCDISRPADAGQACTDSAQCTLFCRTFDQTCEDEGCLGVCAAYTFRSCSTVIEIFGGQPVKTDKGCTVP